jgi:hypothetical protein
LIYCRSIFLPLSNVYIFSLDILLIVCKLTLEKSRSSSSSCDLYSEILFLSSYGTSIQIYFNDIECYFNYWGYFGIRSFLVKGLPYSSKRLTLSSPFYNFILLVFYKNDSFGGESRGRVLSFIPTFEDFYK